MVSERLKAVILKTLVLRDAEIAADTTADQVPGWDSVRHLDILAAVETEFGIEFKSLDVVRLKNVGALQSLVDRKLAAKS